MRKYLLLVATAVSAVTLAEPAAAQWYPQPQQPYSYPVPQPQPYGYGYQNPYQQQPYGYGYQNPYQQPYGYADYGQTRAMKVRIDRIQAELGRLAQYRMISRAEYYNRLRNSREIERRFYRNTRDGSGLSAREMYDVHIRVAQLEQQISVDLRDGRHWGHRW